MVLIIDSVDIYLKGLESFLSSSYPVNTYLVEEKKIPFHPYKEFLVCLFGFTEDFYPEELEIARKFAIQEKLIAIVGNDCFPFLSEILCLNPFSFLHRNTSAKIVKQAVEKALKGERFMDPKVALWIISLKENPLAYLRLTEREREIIFFLGRGLTNKEIAFRLNISEVTVKFYLSRIYRKASVRNRYELKEKLNSFRKFKI